MKIALLVEIRSGSDLRTGEIDNLCRAAREAIQEEDKYIDVVVHEFYSIPGPVDVYVPGLTALE